MLFALSCNIKLAGKMLPSWQAFGSLGEKEERERETSSFSTTEIKGKNMLIRAPKYKRNKEEV